jgi:hypothetical protein
VALDKAPPDVWVVSVWSPVPHLSAIMVGEFKAGGSGNGVAFHGRVS